jgi:superfamily I DNA/RNA helicase
MNQNIYQRSDAAPIRAPVFPLRQNCRNSVPIGEFCAGLVNETMRFSALNGGGETPKPASYTTDDSQLTLIAGRIESLINEGVKPEEIVILGTHTLLRSVFGRTGADTVAGCRIAPMDFSAATREPGVLSYSTLHRYKGLESEIVIICDADGNERTSTPRHLYVAASRARRRLFIYRKKGVALTAE